jgi:hypothetical protein
MAQSATMKQAVRHVADLLQEFARIEGWNSDEFRLFFSVNKAWGRMHVVVAAEAFEGRDSFECYSAVDQFLRERLKDEPELFHSIGIVVRTMRQLQEGGIYSVGPDYFEVKVSGRNLLRRTVRLVAGALGEYAKREGWDDKDYWIYYSIDPEWNRVRFIYVARAFDGGNGRASYDDVMKFLAETLTDEPAVLNSLQLRTCGKEQLDRGELRLGPEFKEYWTFTRP